MHHPKMQRPRKRFAGPPVVCLGLAEGAHAFCESNESSPGLKARALSLSHLTIGTTFRNLHFLDQPPFPCSLIIISGSSKFNTQFQPLRSSAMSPTTGSGGPI